MYFKFQIQNSHLAENASIWQRTVPLDRVTAMSDFLQIDAATDAETLEEKGGEKEGDGRGRATFTSLA